MADSSSSVEAKRIEVPRYILTHKIELSLGLIRAAVILFTLFYYFPIIGNRWYTAYYLVLLANGVTNAIRLYQRSPQPSVTKEFIIHLFSEDSCHYFLYSTIFLHASPISLALLPVFCFSLIHFTSYALSLLDIFKQNSFRGRRLLTLIESQYRSILTVISFTEIMLFPLLVFVFLLNFEILSLIAYYHFLTLRYGSKRNPYSRIMFRKLRISAESTANNTSMPVIIRNFLLFSIRFISKLNPQLPNVDTR